MYRFLESSLVEAVALNYKEELRSIKIVESLNAKVWGSCRRPVGDKIVHHNYNPKPLRDLSECVIAREPKPCSRLYGVAAPDRLRPKALRVTQVTRRC